MKRILVSLTTLALTAGTLGFAGVGTASAHGPCRDGYFCAYRANNYQGKILEHRMNPSQGDVNVLDNATNSVINHTPYVVCGVNDGFPSDQTIITINPGDHRTSIGSDYNKIDWFYARDRAEGCDD